MPILEDLVAVVNENENPYTDMFDGVEYTFEPGIEKIIPVAAANHIFGYGGDQDRKLSRLVRMGVSVLNDEEMTKDVRVESIKRAEKMQKGWTWLGNFKFYPVRTKVERAAEEYVVIRPEKEVLEPPKEESVAIERRHKKR